ncbi:MAG: hypothetical protein AAGI03_15575 [Pseudomonadota bacterium]
MATVEQHAAAILKAVEMGDPRALQAFAIACCSAEDAYLVDQTTDLPAARYTLGVTFLRSLVDWQNQESVSDGDGGG